MRKKKRLKQKGKVELTTNVMVGHDITEQEMATMMENGLKGFVSLIKKEEKPASRSKNLHLTPNQEQVIQALTKCDNQEMIAKALAQQQQQDVGSIQTALEQKNINKLLPYRDECKQILELMGISRNIEEEWKSVTEQFKLDQTGLDDYLKVCIKKILHYLKIYNLELKLADSKVSHTSSSSSSDISLRTTSHKDSNTLLKIINDAFIFDIIDNISLHIGVCDYTKINAEQQKSLLNTCDLFIKIVDRLNQKLKEEAAIYKNSSTLIIMSAVSCFIYIKVLSKQLDIDSSKIYKKAICNLCEVLGSCLDTCQNVECLKEEILEYTTKLFITVNVFIYTSNCLMPQGHEIIPLTIKSIYLLTTLFSKIIWVLEQHLGSKQTDKVIALFFEQIQKLISKLPFNNVQYIDIFKQFIKLIDQLTTRDPNFLKQNDRTILMYIYLSKKISVYYKEIDPGKSLLFLKKVAKYCSNDDLEVFFSIAEKYYFNRSSDGIKSVDKAIKWYKKVISIPDPAKDLANQAIISILSKSCYRLGCIYKDSSQEKLAIHFLNIALEFTPKYMDPQLALAIIELEAGRIDAAENKLLQLLEQDPNNTKVATFLVETYLVQQKYKIAADFLKTNACGLYSLSFLREAMEFFNRDLKEEPIECEIAIEIVEKLNAKVPKYMRNILYYKLIQSHILPKLQLVVAADSEAKNKQEFLITMREFIKKVASQKIDIPEQVYQLLEAIQEKIDLLNKLLPATSYKTIHQTQDPVTSKLVIPVAAKQATLSLPTLKPQLTIDSLLLYITSIVANDNLTPFYRIYYPIQKIQEYSRQNPNEEDLLSVQIACLHQISQHLFAVEKAFKIHLLINNFKYLYELLKSIAIGLEQASSNFCLTGAKIHQLLISLTDFGINYEQYFIKVVEQLFKLMPRIYLDRQDKLKILSTMYNKINLSSGIYSSIVTGSLSIIEQELLENYLELVDEQKIKLLFSFARKIASYEDHLSSAPKSKDLLLTEPLIQTLKDAVKYLYNYLIKIELTTDCDYKILHKCYMAIWYFNKKLDMNLSLIDGQLPQLKEKIKAMQSPCCSDFQNKVFRKIENLCQQYKDKQHLLLFKEHIIETIPVDFAIKKGNSEITLVQADGPQHALVDISSAASMSSSSLYPSLQDSFFSFDLTYTKPKDRLRDWLVIFGEKRAKLQIIFSQDNSTAPKVNDQVEKVFKEILLRS